MDSWLGVEPCDLVGTGMVESSSRVVQRAEPAGEPLGNAVCTQGESHVQSVHSVVRPCGFGVRHNACESADRRRRHMRRKVAFSPAVQFWFPAPDQLCLPPAGVPLSPSSNPSGAPTGFKGSGHVGFRPPSCYLHESALLSPACPDGSGHVGLRPPAAAIKEYLSERVRTVPPVPALVDGAAWNHQRLALVGRLSSRCDSPVLGLAGEFRSLCLPQPSSQAECMVYPLPVSLVSRRTARSFSCAPSFAAPSMSEVEHIPHSAGQFSSGSVEYLQASTLFHAQARVHQPPVLSFPRHRRHRNRQTVLQGAAGATTPRPILNPVPGLEAQPGQAGSTAVASSVPPSEPLRPYTAFDEISCSRTLQAHPSWEPRRYVTHAITSSRLPGCPIGRLMHAHVAGYAVPQVAITQDRRFSARRAVVVDLRDLGHDIETLDVFPSQTVVQVLQLLRTLADANLVLHHLRSGNVHCFVNWDQAAPDAPLGGGADVVELRTVAGRSLRPPTPPLPAAESACSLPAEDPQPLLVGPYRPPHPARRWQRHLGERVGTVLIDSSPELPTCSVFDPLHHAEILSHQACHHPGALLTHAMVAHKDLGGIIDGRVIAFPLPAWPLPQVCVHSWVQASYVVIPVQVGDKVCTLSIMREASVFELMLMLEGRCGIPRSYRHLVAKGWVAVYINEQRIREIFERDSFLFADTARIDAVPALAPSAAPDMLFPDTQLAPRPDGFLTVHRPGFAPSQTYIHPFRTPDDVKSDLRDQGLLGRDGSLQVPLVSPVLVDGGAHLVSLSHEQVLDGRCYMVVDLRRVVHPPFVMFWTTPVVPQFAVAHFEDFLLEEFPSIAPVVNVFVDDIRADAVQMSRRFPFVTVLGAPSDPSHLGCLPLPAVQYSRELLMARPGHRSRAMRLSCALRPPPALTSTSTTTPPVIRSEQDAAAGSNPPVPPTSAEGASSVAGGFRLNPCEDNWQFQYFTVFDSDLQMRFLEKRPDWTTADCTREARRLSRHLPAPHRVVALTSPLPHLPVPQFVLSPNQLIPSSRAVVCDFRPLGLGVCVLDLSFGTTLFEGLSHESHKPGHIQALSRLTR